MSIELLDVLGTDLTVVNAARVSFYKHKELFGEDDAKLLRFLLKHGHWTPFSHSQLQFRIKMPIFVARQWYKHQIGFARNEMSRRYVDEMPEFYRPVIWRSRAANLKQGSSDDEITIVNRHDCDNDIQDEIEELYENIEQLYKDLIDSGVCPEQARMILPQSTYTIFYETASLAAYLRLVSLRNKKEAQVEIQDYAKIIERHLEEAFPETMKAWKMEKEIC